MDGERDDRIRKTEPEEDSKGMKRVKPLDQEPATQRPYDPGFPHPQDDDPDRDLWIDTGEPE